jgi:hypothetical protein
MIIIYGLHKFDRHYVGYRQDFCNQCRTHVTAKRMRYFRCGHLFFIPLLPLGYRETWHCAQCNGDPRARYVERPWLLIVGAVLLGLVGLGGLFSTVAALVASPTDTSSTSLKESVWMFLGMGLGSLFFSWLLFWLARRIKQEDFVRPVLIPNTETCPVCMGKLSTDPHLNCPSCRMPIFTD